MDSTMATGSDFLCSDSLASDQVFDKNCCVCAGDNKVVEAISYCTACVKYFCSKCLDFHNKLHCNHGDKLLDVKSAMQKSLPKATSFDTLTKTCEEHDGKLVEMFCLQHNVVCCTICMSTKHKFCDNGQYIPHIADGFSNGPEVSRIKTELDKIQQDMLRMKSSRQNDQTKFKEERDCVLAQVKAYRQKINQHLDELEETAIREANQRYQNFYESVQEDLTQCDEAIQKIERAVKELEDVDTQNESQMFVIVKKEGESMGKWRKLCRQVHEKSRKEKIEFTVDDTFAKCVANLKTLGTFVEKVKKRRKPHVVVKVEDPVIKMKEDDRTCRVTGLCCLQDGGALLTDGSNNKLKRLDSLYQVTDCLKMDCPADVCYTPDKSEAAVTLGNEQNIIHIVSIASMMRLKRSIKLAGKWCYGVTYNNGLLYVTQDGDALCVYDYQTGQLQTTVSCDDSGQNLFSNKIQHVATNVDGTRIWVADSDKGLILLDRDLQLLREVMDSDLEEVAGVCTKPSDHDDVLVCGYKSKSVVQLTKKGERIGMLIPRDGLPARPLSVCFDRTRSRLLVTMSRYDSIRVLHLR